MSKPCFKHWISPSALVYPPTVVLAQKKTDKTCGIHTCKTEELPLLKLFGTLKALHFKPQKGLSITTETYHKTATSNQASYSWLRKKKVKEWKTREGERRKKKLGQSNLDLAI
jgi:hypothetical protein